MNETYFVNIKIFWASNFFYINIACQLLIRMPYIQCLHASLHLAPASSIDPEMNV